MTFMLWKIKIIFSWIYIIFGRQIMAEILIVDDDAHINDMLSEALEAEGYSVIKSYSGTEALLLLENKIPDLVLLDLMIPGLSGEELLPKIKDTPVIVISAKSDVNDKVGLLLNGAADYITKPFNIKELLARITVQLRNSKNNITSKTVLSFEGIELNTDTHIVTVKKTTSDNPGLISGIESVTEVRLTRTEYAILKLLLQNPEQVVAKLTILENISLDTPDCTEDSLKIHIHNLRKKLKDTIGKDMIKAIWGIGFMITSKS